MDNNIDNWKKLHSADNYFEAHATGSYMVNGKLKDDPDWDIGIIEKHYAIPKEIISVVIGCGYGREAIGLCSRSLDVYGIDVCDSVLSKASKATRDKGFSNFHPVLAERWSENIPVNVGLVYSMNVFQHICKTQTTEYIVGMSKKLCDQGKMVLQFADLVNGADEPEAGRVYEPSIRWTAFEVWKLARQCGLYIDNIDCLIHQEHGLWYIAYLRKP